MAANNHRWLRRSNLARYSTRTPLQDVSGILNTTGSDLDINCNSPKTPNLSKVVGKRHSDVDQVRSLSTNETYTAIQSPFAARDLTPDRDPFNDAFLDVAVTPKMSLVRRFSLRAATTAQAILRLNRRKSRFFTLEEDNDGLTKHLCSENNSSNHADFTVKPSPSLTIEIPVDDPNYLQAASPKSPSDDLNTAFREDEDELEPKEHVTVFTLDDENEDITDDEICRPLPRKGIEYEKAKNRWCGRQIEPIPDEPVNIQLGLTKPDPGDDEVRTWGACAFLAEPSTCSLKIRDLRNSDPTYPVVENQESMSAEEITVFKENDMESAESSSALADSDSDTTPRPKGVIRWHSFQRASVRPESYIGQPVSSMSSGQLLVLRKLALLKLTSIMEKHCPTHRTGWNWELPKFMRKIKNPDYKDKTVFGVPLFVVLQRTGQTLPTSIQGALSWLRGNALEQVGIFRKPGVKSRILKLKLMVDTQGDEITFEGQTAFDVADMVKLYFRELPEALLTNKLSETFIAIFQHVPVGLRIEAVQCALLLLPDEHREALQYLLNFLAEVASNAPTNQMNASNLALCLAPSLFQWSFIPARNTSASPRKNNGVPDPRQVGHNKAANDCLLTLIKNHKEAFNICDELLAQCHFSYMEESVPVSLDDLGSDSGQDWKGYLNACQTALMKEAREKSRGWVSNGSFKGVDVSFKKVGDGHPLKLWRVSTEVEAPPTELLHRVLRERQLWDPSMVKWRVVARLDTNAEVFQYLTSSLPPIPSKDYCVLRTWKTELAKGACVIVETSVEHPEGQVLSGGIRGVLLASRYLIEPCGSGKSRIIHLSRVDTKGRTPDWYNKTYGHLCALFLSKIRSSFRHVAEGPESKV